MTYGSNATSPTDEPPEETPTSSRGRLLLVAHELRVGRERDRPLVGRQEAVGLLGGVHDAVGMVPPLRRMLVSLIGLRRSRRSRSLHAERIVGIGRPHGVEVAVVGTEHVLLDLRNGSPGRTRWRARRTVPLQVAHVAVARREDREVGGAIGRAPLVVDRSQRDHRGEVVAATRCRTAAAVESMKLVTASPPGSWPIRPIREKSSLPTRLSPRLWSASAGTGASRRA